MILRLAGDRPRLNNLCLPFVKTEDLSNGVVRTEHFLILADEFAIKIKIRTVEKKNIRLCQYYVNLRWENYLLAERFSFFAKMLISFIGKYTDLYNDEKPNAYYSHITWDMINEMLSSGRVEIGNHTYSMHTNGQRKGSKKISGETDEHYTKILIEDIGKLQDETYEHTGIYPAVYAYPFGAISSASFNVLSDMGFLATLSCAEKASVITQGEPNSLRCLGRFLRPAAMSSANFFENKIKIEGLYE